MTTRAATEGGKQFNAYPRWCLRFWHGMRVRDYVGLLLKNQFRVHPIQWPRMCTCAFASGINSASYRLQRSVFGRAIDQTVIDRPPVFIIGHWRSGTTYLHELLVRDQQFGFPTTFQCLAPHHFLVTEWVLPRLLWFMVPPKRPMDNMALSFDHPQEDELALCAMGAPTPYFRIAFPNHAPVYMELLDMEGVSEQDLHRFQQAMLTFVKTLMYRYDKRLMLKSPAHTGRIEVLAKLFPGARFVHMVRDPYALFPSTRRLWQALDRAQGFQIPRHENLNEYILQCFERMYRGFERQRTRVDPMSICDVRYEDLVRDPVGEVQMLYEKLELGDFQQVRANLVDYVRGQKDYRPNQHQLEPELQRDIDRRWSGYMERYGYSKSSCAEAGTG